MELGRQSIVADYEKEKWCVVGKPDTTG